MWVDLLFRCRRANQLARPTKQRTRRKSARRAFLDKLRNIYEQATGRRAGVSKHPGTGSPSGPFFRFARACTVGLPELDVLSDDALAQALRGVLKGR